MSPRVLQGVGCAPGRCAGRAWPLAPAAPQTGTLDQVRSALRTELHRRRAALTTASGEDLSHIDVLLALLDDPALVEPALRLEDAGLSPAAAIEAALRPVITRLMVTGDPELVARAGELRTLASRLFQPGARVELPPRPVVLIAADLSADQLLGFVGPSGRAQVRGLLLERGGPLTHTSILARQRGIPVVAGLHGLVDDVAPGEGLLVDGHRGRVVVSPGRAEVAAFTAASRSSLSPPAVTGAFDGAPQLRRFANVQTPEESALARGLGAEGLSLVRTDLLLARGGDPSEDEQFDWYRRILQPWSGCRAWIRTFDAPEAGACSALGPRGARWFELDPERSRRQLRALARAAASCPDVQAGVLIPMVSRPAELRAIRAVLREFGQPGVLLPQLGCMIETPAAALRADEIFDEAEFVAVGTNDLLQLLVGASREDHRLAPLLDPEDPSLWELLGRVGAVSRAKGRPAVVCGILAERTDARPRLKELGFLGVGLGASALAKLDRRRPHGG